MTNMIKRDNRNGAMTTRPEMPLGTWVDGILKNTLSQFFEDDVFGFSAAQKMGNVPVNISETEKTYELELVAPGLQKEDFSVSLHNNVLTVSFEHKQESKVEDNKKNYVRQEFSMQSFSRSFNLDETIDAENINAQYENGLLHLTLPKKEGATLSKTIEIK